MNIFQKIGNNIEKEKLKRKKFEDNYWKLSPIERIDYDLKRERIRKEFGNPLQYLTLVAEFLFFYAIFGLISALFVPQMFTEFFEKSIFIVFFIFISVVIGVGILNLVFGRDEDRMIKELNKRFKL